MQRSWWYAAGGAVAVVALALGAVFLFVGSGHGNSTSADGNSTRADGTGCSPTTSTSSAGNAKISARALGESYGRKIVIRVTDKESGTPLRDANVKVRAEMICPHLMPLMERNLRESASGTYKGDYNLIMPGHWTIYITVRSKQGDATTSALPIEVRP
jgi:hypothetical protein